MSEGRAFFGRRKGKRLRAGQEELLRALLPALRVPRGDDIATCLAACSEWRLEIGFGGGEHLAAEARAHPTVGFIGCEPFVNGMAKLLAVIDAEGLRNIRLFEEDIAQLLPRLPDALLSRVSITLYPDPWPKRRNRKRRIVSEALLAELARLMRPGAELRFATDIDDYAGWVLARLLRSPDFCWTALHADDWRRPWPAWPGTRYEAKALREGRVPTYVTAVRQPTFR